jgi:hypothetical protein
MCHPNFVTKRQLERALLTMARIIIQPGGEVYAPLYERLEAELAERARTSDTRLRARELLKNHGTEMT